MKNKIIIGSLAFILLFGCFSGYFFSVKVHRTDLPNESSSDLSDSSSLETTDGDSTSTKNDSTSKYWDKDISAESAAFSVDSKFPSDGDYAKKNKKSLATNKGIDLDYPVCWTPSETKDDDDTIEFTTPAAVVSMSETVFDSSNTCAVHGGTIADKAEVKEAKEDLVAEQEVGGVIAVLKNDETDLGYEIQYRQQLGTLGWIEDWSLITSSATIRISYVVENAGQGANIEDYKAYLRMIDSAKESLRKVMR